MTTPTRTKHPRTLELEDRIADSSGAPAGTLPRSAFHILAVDDARDVVELLAILLRSVGHEVRTAYDGREALELIERWPPEVLLSDIGMPVMGGLELARKIRDSKKWPAMVLIALSGKTQTADRAAAFKAGFDFYLAKPASVERIQEIMATLAAHPRRALAGLGSAASARPQSSREKSGAPNSSPQSNSISKATSFPREPEMKAKTQSKRKDPGKIAEKPVLSLVGQSVKSDAELTRNLKDGIDDDAKSLEEQALAADDCQVESDVEAAKTHFLGEPGTEAARLRMIAEAAFYKAEQRNFAPGYEEADWLEAEREIDAERARALRR